jgi:hypothetical protein
MPEEFDGVRSFVGSSDLPLPTIEVLLGFACGNHVERFAEGGFGCLLDFFDNV